MTLELRSGDVVIYCPFCQKYGIKAFYRAGYRGFGKSRGSGVTSTFSTKKNDEYVILADCPACGAKQSDIQKKI